MPDNPETLRATAASLLAERAVLKRRNREIGIKLKRIRAKLDRFPPADTIIEPMDSTSAADKIDDMLDLFLGD